MSPNVRKSVYTALVVLNAVLLGCVQQNVLPSAWASGMAIASIAVAALMKEFSAPAELPDETK